jgi:carbamoyl-phosphate synthase large subunit
MGVHTGESITVAPAQTLTDAEYQRLRNAAMAIMREIGVETGGSNVQFAVHPQTGEVIVIEMNPRVSRSSALASKATGFPIARIAAKLAIGYTLDEIPNDITRETLASFEPTLDYCVVKIPRWTFEKFPETEDFLTTSMKSVGETMAIGRTFKEALQKAVRSLEIGRFGLLEPLQEAPGLEEQIKAKLITPNSLRLFYLAAALKYGMTLEEIHQLTRIDPWFLDQIRQIVQAEAVLQLEGPSGEMLREAKRWGFSDRRLGELWGVPEGEIRSRRFSENLLPVYKLVDTCAAEFEAYIPYYYATYEEETEARPSDKRKVLIIGGGPNRIGQGIEFDYCCVHASFALREEGYESLMVNSNPETVSTDYDTSDKLFFEPVTLEDVLHIIACEKPDGVIVQFGGQTPLNLAKNLEAAGARILGTSPDSIDRAENRKRFQEIVNKLKLNQPDNATATDVAGALAAAERIGYPVLVRPSYVLGGRSMEIVYDAATLSQFMERALKVSPDHPILIDQFLEDAIEVDVDAISDGSERVVAGMMEHIEEAGSIPGTAPVFCPP